MSKTLSNGAISVAPDENHPKSLCVLSAAHCSSYFPSQLVIPIHDHRSSFSCISIRHIPSLSSSFLFLISLHHFGSYFLFRIQLLNSYPESIFRNYLPNIFISFLFRNHLPHFSSKFIFRISLPTYSSHIIFQIPCQTFLPKFVAEDPQSFWAKALRIQLICMW